VDVHVRAHPIFERDGADLACKVPVSFATAALGGTVQVPTLNGEVTLKIPSETQSGKVFRLRGKGVKPVRDRSVGDLYCRVELETPANLSARQKELLREFDKTLDDNGARHRPLWTSWADGVRRFFDNMTP
jgi:molecular chaperone DnaJ